MHVTVPFAIPDVGDREIAAVVEVLRSGWLTSGPTAKRFEEAFAQKVGAPEAIAVNSCTAALHLALEAVGVGPGDEVVVPTTTFAATAEVVLYLGARPVLVDVRGSDHGLEPSAFERAIGPKTKAVLPVHFAGQPVDMDPILELARARDIAVIEDAAHAFPASYKGKRVGTLGDITCFSFYATKTITTGEGGMATTSRPDWAARMRSMSLHGLSKDAWKRYDAKGSWYYEIVAPGYKYNMTDMAAALGLVQLDRAEAMRNRRREIAEAYTRAFVTNDALELLEHRPEVEHAWHLFVVKLRDGMLSVDRNRFIEELKTAGIGASVHFIPLHLHPFYRDAHGYLPDQLPVATDVYSRSISLPIYSKMTDEQVSHVIEVVAGLTTALRR